MLPYAFSKWKVASGKCQVAKYEYVYVYNMWNYELGGSLNFL